MSVRAMTAAWDAGADMNLDPVGRLILLRLGDAADDFGYSWLGIDDLELFVGADRRTIQRHMKRLVLVRALDRVVVGGGRGRPTLYRVLPLILDDSDAAPGRRRYEQRFRVTARKGRQSVTVTDDERAATTTLKGGNDDAKGRHPRRPIPKEPKGTAEPVAVVDDPTVADVDLDLPPREPGESWKRYIERVYPPTTLPSRKDQTA